MVTLAFKVPGIPKIDYNATGYAVGFKIESQSVYDVITFDNHTEAARYCIYAGRRPVKSSEINVKKDHFNFSRWFPSEMEISDRMLEEMKDL